MIRLVLRAVLGLALRIFFHHVEVAGTERVPLQGGVIYVLNHPNALIDPLFLQCLTPRPVSFLAKAPLFRMPVVGFLVRSMGALPVYRIQDALDPRKNLETFRRARSILKGGGTIALFPEGTTHSDPKLRPMKTGAARIAIGAASTGEGMKLAIVPTGLYYTEKRLFRSSVLVQFGDPITVDPQHIEDGEPPREAVRTLSEQIREGLIAVTINADNHEALAWIERGQRLFSEPTDGAEEGHLASEFAMRRRFVDGYEWVCRNRPDRLRELERRVEDYERSARAAGAAPYSLTLRAKPETGPGNMAAMAAMGASALLGAVLHWLPYRLIGLIADRVDRRDPTAVSTVKMGVSLVLYPLFWLVLAVLAARIWGFRVSMVAAALFPALAWCAVLYQERLWRFREARALRALQRRNSSLFERLLAERIAIREVITQLADEWEREVGVCAVTPKAPP